MYIFLKHLTSLYVYGKGLFFLPEDTLSLPLYHTYTPWHKLQWWCHTRSGWRCSGPGSTTWQMSWSCWSTSPWSHNVPCEKHYNYSHYFKFCNSLHTVRDDGLIFYKKKSNRQINMKCAQMKTGYFSQIRLSWKDYVTMTQHFHEQFVMGQGSRLISQLLGPITVKNTKTAAFSCQVSSVMVLQYKRLLFDL